MRAYLLSDKEREIIHRYLNEDLRLDGITVLRHRIRQHLPRIKEDLDLIKKFMGEG